MPEGHAAFAGRRIWYRDSGGKGVPAVFLHAGTGSSLVWELQVPAFTAAGYRFISYDRLGHGRAVLEPGAQPGTAPDDLEGLARHLRLDRFHLVGTAAGGIVALDYALSFAQRLRSLVVANSIGGVEDQDYQALQPQLRELGPSYRAANPQGEARWIELEHLSNATRLPAQATRNRLSFSLLETIMVPALLLTGDADLYTPPAVLRLFAARIRNSRSIVIGECGHSAYWEQPEAFNREVLAFLGKH